MPDYAAQRFNMVESQVRTNDVPDPRIQEAMLAIPRERFVPAANRAVAYAETAAEVVPGRFLMEPRTLAKLLYLAEIDGGSRVLVVGCATGYSAAVIAKMAAKVTALETDVDLVRVASDMLQAVGASNAQVVQGSLSDGNKTNGPYDVILIDGAVETVPEALTAQLADGGRLVTVIQDGAHSRAHLYIRRGSHIGDRVDFDAPAPALPGFKKAVGFVF
jgi:protein-L-isoaspartate(D-aspartate) O-methyltransferase